ncbi:hypothetical protein NUSPORA_01530 [Nucleospora cyclopteri]
MAVKDYKKNVEAKMRLEENKKCADCRAANPRWVSCKYGVFLCLECAGIHRALGVNYDFIKSATLDQWSREAYLPIKYGGNSKFISFLKEKNLLNIEVLDKYRNPVVMEYSKSLIDEVKNATGETLKHAEANCTTESETLNQETTNFRPNQQNFVYMHQKKSGSASQLFRDTTESLRNKLAHYSPTLANFSTCTINKVSDISSSIYNHTKSFGSKTFIATAKLSSKIIDEAKSVRDKKQHNINKSTEELSKQNVMTSFARKKAESKDWS